MFEEDVVEEVVGEVAGGALCHLRLVTEDFVPEAPKVEAPPEPKRPYISVDEACVRIRKALKARSGKDWSVTRGRGTAYSWLRIKAPPKRMAGYSMTEEDCAELAKLLGKDHVHHQGQNIPAGGDYRAEYVARAEGRDPEVYGVQYWD